MKREHDGAGRSGIRLTLPARPDDRRIDKDDVGGARDRLHQFRSELVLADDLDFGIVNQVPEELRDDVACAIIAAQRVAVTDNQRV